MKLIKHTLFLYILFAFSCECSDLSEDTKKMIDSANLIGKPDIKIENIPFEFIYINLKLNSNKIDTAKIFDIYSILCKKDEGKGWQTLSIYNKNNKYIFSYSGGNNFYQQIGD